MALLEFPSTLPQPSLIQMTPNERRLLSSLTQGLDRARTIQTNFIGTENLQWQFTATQAAIFEDWWRNMLLQGGRWFTSYWQHINQTAMLCRFTKAPNWKYIGNDYWQVTVSTELEGIYNQTNFDREPGGSSLYSQYMVIIGERYPTSGHQNGYYEGSSFSAVRVYNATINEATAAISFYFALKANGAYPDGDSVLFTATSTRTSGGGPASITPLLFASNPTTTSTVVSGGSKPSPNFALPGPVRFNGIALTGDINYFTSSYTTVVTVYVNSVAVFSWQVLTQPSTFHSNEMLLTAFAAEL